MDPDTLSDEARYRYEERLGMLCGTDTPTDEQRRTAWLEAKEWELNNFPE